MIRELGVFVLVAVSITGIPEGLQAFDKESPAKTMQSSVSIADDITLARLRGQAESIAIGENGGFVSRFFITNNTTNHIGTQNNNTAITGTNVSIIDVQAVNGTATVNAGGTQSANNTNTSGEVITGGNVNTTQGVKTGKITYMGEFTTVIPCCPQ